MRDLDSGEAVLYPPGKVRDGLPLLVQADEVWYHNGVKFDVPSILKLFPDFDPKPFTGASYKENVRDSLVAARFIYAHIKDTDWERSKRGKLPGKLIGSHSLKAWGYRLGEYKGEYTGGWDEYNDEMGRYCVQDTNVTRTLVLKLKPHLARTPDAWDTELRLAWYLAAQERNGFPFNTDAARDLQGTLAARREVLGAALRAEFGSWEADNGKPFIPKRDNKRFGYTAGVPVQKKKIVEFNPASRDHIANRLQTLYGWQPTEFTDSGKAQVDESTLKALAFPSAPTLLEYLLIDKRLGQLAEGKQAWLKVVAGDGAIHGSVNQGGAVTHRATHAYPNISQVPSVEAPYGRQCRALFHAPAGWKLLGADASGLELRCLAHYMARYDGGAYGRILLESDIHTANQHAAGLTTRAQAKTFIYAWLYGAGDEKIGSITHPDATPEHQKRQGAKLKRRFLQNTPALGQLLDAVKVSAAERGYVRLIDGRRAYVRSEHAALNTLLQGTGAVICKRWIVEFERRMLAQHRAQGWDGRWAACAWIHDEIQVAVVDDYGESAAALAVASIEAMTDHFKFRVPLTGEAKLGQTWADTH